MELSFFYFGHLIIQLTEIRRGEAVIGAVLWFYWQKINKNGKKALVLRD